MFVLYGPVTSPKSAAWWTRSATFALQISFLLGRQLMLGHEPPIHRRSTTAVRCPALAMSQARSFPPAPLPRMRISYRSVGIVASRSCSKICIGSEGSGAAQDQTCQAREIQQVDLVADRSELRTCSGHRDELDRTEPVAQMHREDGHQQEYRHWYAGER